MLKRLINTLPQVGEVQWIGLRPGRGEPMNSVQTADLDTDVGLVGDRYSGRSGSRHVTLIQAEHLPVIASCTGADQVSPELLRRNILVQGVNLLALKDKRFKLGSALLEYTGLCHPCSRMEELLGTGGYNAVRGHGGINARVLASGTVAVGNKLRAVQESYT
ncbi:MAG: MOSC domain-containing protein [Pseudomonadota bacterium]